MNNMMKYKGYLAKIQLSEEDRIFYGEVLGLSDSVAFDGSTFEELERSFHAAVDGYLELCKEINKEPEKGYNGVFNVRISPELHKRAVYEAFKRGVKLNKFVEQAIEEKVSSNNTANIIYSIYNAYCNE